MSKIIKQVTIENRNYPMTFYYCDGCANEFIPSNEPCIVVQTVITVVYPNGQTEAIHINNETTGRFSYYCGSCLMQGKIPVVTDAELVRFYASLPPKEASSDEAAQVQQTTAEIIPADNFAQE